MDALLLLLLEVGVSIIIVVLKILVEQIEQLAKSQNVIILCVLGLFFAFTTNLLLWLVRIHKRGRRKSTLGVWIFFMRFSAFLP